MNDYFYIRGNSLYNIKSMRIFNRWGQPMFEKLNFAANSQMEGWDGRYKGIPQPPGVYVYIAEVYCTSGTVLTSNGTITLVR
jgi:gliding motility-associated-like protein